MEALLILVILAGFLAVLAGTVVAGRMLPQPSTFTLHSTIGQGIPSRRRAILFSKSERAFYKALRSIVPDHMIFIKVKLADLVSVPSRQSFWEHFNAINRKHIDFVVCDRTMSPVLAIDLDERSHSKVVGLSADMASSALAKVSLPLVHVPQKRSYLFDELRRILGPYLIVPRPLL